MQFITKSPEETERLGERLGQTLRGGEVIAYLGDLSVYHVRLKSGQMISAQLQNAHRHRKGLPTWGDEVRLCWEVDSCVVLTV